MALLFMGEGALSKTRIVVVHGCGIYIPYTRNDIKGETFYAEGYGVTEAA